VVLALRRVPPFAPPHQAGMSTLKDYLINRSNIAKNSAIAKDLTIVMNSGV